MPKLPIVRFAEWLSKRLAACSFCGKAPRVVIDGDRRYCSIECAELDGETQAIA